MNATIDFPTRNLDSDIIKYIRFPLIAWVVFAHSVLCSAPELLSNGYYLPSYIIAFLRIGIRTPIFFFISGYCFFLNVATFDFQTYISKLKRRCYTLLIPYIIWNIVVILYFLSAHTFFPNFINLENENILEYSILDFFRAFWDKSGGQPIAYQLWFLRDLMVVCIFTPIIYFLCKKAKIIGLIAILAVFLSNNWFPFKSAFVFFYIGAYFSVNKKSFSNCIHIFNKYGGVYISLLIIISTIVFPEILILNKVCILFFATTFISLISYIVSKGHKMIKILNDSNYFIYLWHGFPIIVIKDIYLKFISPSTGIEYLAGTFVVCIVTILIGLALYYFINKCFPRITAVLIGKNVASSPQKRIG